MERKLKEVEDEGTSKMSIKVRNKAGEIAQIRNQKTNTEGIFLISV